MKEDMTVEEALDVLLDALHLDGFNFVGDKGDLVLEYHAAFHVITEKCEVYWCEHQDRFKSIHNEGH